MVLRLVALLGVAACHPGTSGAPATGHAEPAPPAAGDPVPAPAPWSPHVALDGGERLDDVTVAQAPDGYRTDLRARATDGVVRAIDLVIIRLHGPGTYPFGFGWDRGATRATITTVDGAPCMTPTRDAGTLEITAGPPDGVLAPGVRLEGRFEVRCYPKGDPALGAAASYAGRFEVAAP